MSADVRTSAASDEAVAALLLEWAPAQRWFAHKGVAAHVERIERTPLDEGGVAQLVALTVRSGEGEDAPRTVYSVPISVRPAPDEALAAALVGELPDVDGARAWVYDGPHDPTWTRALLTLVASEEGAGSRSFGVHGTSADGGLPVPAGARTKVLGGEQSNTSIVVAADEGETPLIAKVFRVLSAGDNPDVVVQTALADAGCGRVPRPSGWVDGHWTDVSGERVAGHFVHLTEFLAGSEDAWRVATAAVAQGRDFSAEARELGRATAEVHAVLAAELATEEATPQRLAALADGLLERVEWATTAVPQLREVAGAARARVDAVRGVAHAPALQRVHGDYHLGQVLHSASRGWVLLDFEGEPLRPLSERSLPDLALRDVAGMLRSFDYAASTVPDPGDWGPRAREAFLDGYAEVVGTDPRQGEQAVLLAALELDKALYEVVYEARNRPDWLRIPLDAVHRLLQSASADPS
ncbi:maltokinase N-terminal cap-like domain-containing protein [Kineococcus radiotolerans]|uniref:Maltokinase n=1 Tax=Kineococcus radiotolerans (strain ATCC BAA-149 / DSM 14245 / SRS30216) TaxID=266940 RepID=A6W7J4_KINRD|nr:1,4-alpha-glucan-branching protein [Kineococcus radiotolerans]ABS02783.1 1,4-alpha-glucan branching enzyme [Kineococcus radiotolerans SRS30216 = ATCC BAA-149]